MMAGMRFLERAILWFRSRRQSGSTSMPLAITVGKLRVWATLATFALLAPGSEAASPQFASAPAWVQILPDGAAVRAITTERSCPSVLFDGRATRMAERAPPDADFQVRSCEASVPIGTKRIVLAGKTLPIPPRSPRRIAVVGDTGCRMKAAAGLDYGFQACNVPEEWPFARIAEQIAAWKPDLIIHVGDYVYREQPCPPGDRGCAGSPIDAPRQRWATWQADWFRPAARLFTAAALVLVRGDHESCARAGPGWFRFLDAGPMQPCNDLGEAYAIDFENLRLVIMDTVLAEDTTLSPDEVRAHYTRQFDRARQLSSGRTWLVSHRPLWGVRPTDRGGGKVEPMNLTLQDALAQSVGLSPQTDLVLTGHIHLGEIISFKRDRPPQMIVGTGGTLMLPPISAKLAGMEIDGVPVENVTVVSTYGFFGFEPSRGGWRVTFVDVRGKRQAECRFADRSFACLR